MSKSKKALDGDAKKEAADPAGPPLPDHAGFGLPPVASRFKKGRSGNPKGRPKKSRNLRTEMRETLFQPMAVRIGGKTKKVSAVNALAINTLGAAFRGDMRATDKIFKLADRYPADDASNEEPLTEDDRLILYQTLERMVEERLRARAQEAAAEKESCNLPAESRPVAKAEQTGGGTEPTDVPAVSDTQGHPISAASENRVRRDPPAAESMEAEVPARAQAAHRPTSATDNRGQRAAVAAADRLDATVDPNLDLPIVDRRRSRGFVRC